MRERKWKQTASQDMNTPTEFVVFVLEMCVCALCFYLFEISVLGNLHQLHLLFLSLDHECLFDVLRGAAVQRHWNDLRNVLRFVCFL